MELREDKVRYLSSDEWSPCFSDPSIPFVVREAKEKTETGLPDWKLLNQLLLCPEMLYRGFQRSFKLPGALFYAGNFWFFKSLLQRTLHRPL